MPAPALIIHLIFVEFLGCRGNLSIARFPSVFLGCRGKAPQHGAAASERQISAWNSRDSQHKAGGPGACFPQHEPATPAPTFLLVALVARRFDEEHKKT